MFFFACMFVVALLTAFIPVILSILNHFRLIRIHPANHLLPILAAILFLVSFYLPDIHISSQTSTFQQHFVGGGMYSALLYIYAKQLAGKRHLAWWLDAAMLFGWVSALGVANKLLEFFLLEIGSLQLDTSDVYWDLLANTLGAFVLYYAVQGLYFILKQVR